jgi:hypothetical protein
MSIALLNDPSVAASLQPTFGNVGVLGNVSVAGSNGADPITAETQQVLNDGAVCYSMTAASAAAPPFKLALKDTILTPSAGADFVLYRYDNAGTGVAEAIRVKRSNGVVSMPYVQGNLSICFLYTAGSSTPIPLMGTKDGNQIPLGSSYNGALAGAYLPAYGQLIITPTAGGAVTISNATAFPAFVTETANRNYTGATYILQFVPPAYA